MNDQPTDNRIRLVLLDGFELFRVCLGRVLRSEPGLEVVGECGASSEALQVLESSVVDVVLLDFEIGAEHGNDFISSARQAGYQGRFLIVVGSADVRSSAIALKRGVSGIFLKTEAPDRLVQAIRHVAGGGVWIDQRILGLLADRLVEPDTVPPSGNAGHRLEDRERCVLRGIVGGLTNRKIGAGMGLTESAVKNTVQRLFGKAGVKTRGQLVRATLEGFLGPVEELVGQLHPEVPSLPAECRTPWRPSATELPREASLQQPFD